MDLTLGQLVSKTIILYAILVITKVVFFTYLNIDLWPILILFYVVVAATAIAVVRRFGDINYFESFLILLVWIVVGLLVDVIITSKLVGDGFFTNKHEWLSYIAVIAAVLVFDRKEHVATRKAAAK